MNQPECQVLDSASNVNVFSRTNIFKFRVIVSVGNLMGKACGIGRDNRNACMDLMKKPIEKRPH